MFRGLLDQLRGRRAESGDDVPPSGPPAPYGQPAMLGWRGGTFELRILNLSQHGLLGECEVATAAGDPISVTTADGQRAGARVRWVRGTRFGAQLIVDFADASAPTAPGRRVRRPPRINLDLAAVARSSGRQARVQVRNISAAGAMFEVALPPAVGQRVELHIEGHLTLAGRIRWVRSGRVGLVFDTPLSEADFRRFADSR